MAVVKGVIRATTAPHATTVYMARTCALHHSPRPRARVIVYHIHLAGCWLAAGCPGSCRSCSLLTPGTPWRFTGVVGRAGHPWLVLWAGQHDSSLIGCQPILLSFAGCPGSHRSCSLLTPGMPQRFTGVVGRAGHPWLVLWAGQHHLCDLCCQLCTCGDRV